MPGYQRTYEELEKVASKFWPSELADKEANLSVIPLLLQTQDAFLAILSVDPKSIEGLFGVIEASEMAANIFVKHLVILADFGGESLQRVSSEFKGLFPKGVLNYIWKGTQAAYEFRALPRLELTNKSLHIDGKQLLDPHELDDLKRDAIALLLFGSVYSGDEEETARALSKCEVGEYLGKPAELERFVDQRYIWVSRITGGATANTLGQLAQQFVRDYVLENSRVAGIKVAPGRLPGVSHTDPITNRETSFDLVATNNRRYVAIEVSFQVTTNSTIERKSGQARDRFAKVEKTGHRIAYVIDGAGNFAREAAIRVMLSHSHCSVAFSRLELDLLCRFVREFLES